MFTPITQLLQKNRGKKIVFIFFCISLLSLYPIYKNFYNGRAITTYERHVALIQGKSEYYNPWQYRMLCPFIIESMKWVYDHTLDKVLPIEKILQNRVNENSQTTPEAKEFIHMFSNPEVVKYMIVFIFFRYCLNFLVFTLAFCLWRYFVANNWLVFFGLIFISLSMGNGVIASDLTFNTYLDINFYLISACIIVYKKSPSWLLLIIFLAALNRETSMMIPFLFFISYIDFSAFSKKAIRLSLIKWPAKRIWWLVSIGYLIFFTVFFSLRLYYGYRVPQIWKVPSGINMIKLNLFSGIAIKSYFEMLGVFSVIPFIILYKFKSYPLLLRVWFIGIVPAWLAVHIYSVVIYQTRLFLVPTVLVMMPMLLWLIENYYQKIKTEKSQDFPPVSL